MTNDQWAAHGLSLKEVLVAFPVTPKEVFGHEASNQVTIWATSSAVFRDDVKDDEDSVDWSYFGEYIFVFSFNQAGDKVERVLEFLDSKKVEEVRALMQRARRNLAAKKVQSS